jgi:hypothetical protein
LGATIAPLDNIGIGGVVLMRVARSWDWWVGMEWATARVNNNGASSGSQVHIMYLDYSRYVDLQTVIHSLDLQVCHSGVSPMEKAMGYLTFIC